LQAPSGEKNESFFHDSRLGPFYFGGGMMGKIRDITGQKFGRLTVLNYEYTDRQAYWRFRCDCGNEKVLMGSRVANGKVQSCGCLLVEKIIENGKNKKIDLSGKRFGRLVVISETTKRQGTHIIWECICDCGNIHFASGGDLRRGGVTSCGCYAREVSSRINTVHGGEGTTEYIKWASMKSRCYYPKNESYSHYGARGISVCNRWRNNFGNFLKDMGKCPEGLTLERTDNDKGYSPGNCRWATVKEQNHNKRSNVWVEYCGEKLIRADWIRRLKITVGQWSGKQQKGWSPFDIVAFYAVR